MKHVYQILLIVIRNDENVEGTPEMRETTNLGYEGIPESRTTPESGDVTAAVETPLTPVLEGNEAQPFTPTEIHESGSDEKPQMLNQNQRRNQKPNLKRACCLSPS